MAQQTGGQQELYAVTQKRMERIQKALHSFAATHDRLPCPADGATKKDGVNFALELRQPVGTGACSITSQHAALPWRTLGIPFEESLDGWGRKISYQVCGDISGPGATVSNADRHIDPYDPRNSCFGFSVKNFGTEKKQVAWVLISHGPSGVGAWPAECLPGNCRPQPSPASPDEQANLNVPGTTKFVRRAEEVLDLDPAQSPSHFDDMLLFESVDELQKISGFPVGSGFLNIIDLTKGRLQSGNPKGDEVVFNGRVSDKNKIIFDGGLHWGNVAVSAHPGALLATNGEGSALGVCASARNCGSDTASVLDKNKFLKFSLPAGKMAAGFGLRIFSLEPRAEMVLTFKRPQDAQTLDSKVSLNLPIPKFPDFAGKGEIKPTFAHPPQEFSEVTIQPTGSSRFFISAIRFCRENESCT